MAVVALQTVQILSFPQSHLLEAVKVALAVVLPQALPEVLVEELAVILGMLAGLVTRLLQAHHKVAMVGLALHHLGVLI